MKYYVWVILLAAAVVTPVRAGTYYVSTSGNDKNAGSEEQPFRTIAKGADVARAGDTILVRGGVYPEHVVMRFSGREGKPIVLKNYLGEKPVIQPGERLTYYVAEPRPKQQPVSRSAKDTLVYQVQPGDNLTKIADLFYVTADVLRRVNGLPHNGLIRSGDLLKVPVGTRTSGGRSPKQSTGRTIYYEVRRGDNLWNISQLFGVPLAEVRDDNALGRDARIMPGDTLKVVLPEGR